MEETLAGRNDELASPRNARLYEGRVARMHDDGDPLRYAWGDEFRDSAGVNEIVAELQASKPFSLLHPDDLISRGAKADIVGSVFGARVDGAFVVAQILVTDARALEAITNGVHELSLGYTSRLDANRRQRDIKVDHIALVPRARCGSACALRTDCLGNCTPACHKYTMSYNTVAVANTVTKGDGDIRHELPSSMFAAADSKMALEDESNVKSAMTRFPLVDFKGPSERKAAFHTIIARAHQLGIDPAAFEQRQSGSPDQGIVMDELQKKLAEALAVGAENKARADQLDTELKQLKAVVTTAEVNATNAQAALVAERKLTETANARADQAKADAEVAISKAKLDATNAVSVAVTSRVQLLTEAAHVLGAKDPKGQIIDRSAMDDQAIRLAVIKHVDNLDFPQDKDPVFVAGVYAGSLARAAQASASRASVRATTVQVRANAAKAAAGSTARDLEVSAQKAMQDDQAKRWRTNAN